MTAARSKSKAQTTVMTALMTAVTAIITMFAVPVPFTNGYIHFGDSMVFLGVFILGWRWGAVSAAIGSALADILLGYVQWAPFTFVIKGVMALICGLIIAKCTTGKRLALAAVIVAVYWVAFNFVITNLIRLQSRTDLTGLMSLAGDDAGTSGESEFEMFVEVVQSRIMICALAIPIVLVVLYLCLRKSKKFDISFRQMVAVSGAGIFMVFGYYLSGGVLLGANTSAFTISAFSIPANVVQFFAGFIVANLLSVALSRTRLIKVS